MQISSSAFSTLPVPINRRDELSDRRQSERRQADVAATTSDAAATTTERGEVTRIRPRPSAAIQRADSQTPRNLPARGRDAVAAYSSNGPTIEERLGVELVGVDLYV